MSAAVRLPDRGLLDILSGSADPVTDGWGTSAFYDAARAEGVLPVVLDCVAQRGWPGVSDQLRARLERERDAAVALAALSSMDLIRVLAALSAAGVHPLVIKGAALAHTHYARPSHRPMIDTDLLIRARDIDAAHAVFRSLGAEYIPHVTGSLVMSQFHYASTDRAGCQHVYDVHWRIANRQVFAAVLSYEEMAAQAIGVPALGASARAPGTVHALLLACIHRAAHHGGTGPLIWLLDIHRLAGSLGDGESRSLVAEATSRAIAAVTEAALRDAHAICGGIATTRLAAALAGVAGEGAEPSARFLTSRSRVSETLDELRALPGGRPRLRLVREWIFPPAEYMRATYAPASRLPLPLLYLTRAVAGALGWHRQRF